MKIFLNYVHKDRIKVDEVKKELDLLGLVYFEMVEGSGTANIVKKTVEVIHAADYILLFLSKNSLDSEYFKFEFSEAILHELTSGRTILVPVKIDNCVTPPLLRNRKCYGITPCDVRALSKNLLHRDYVFEPDNLNIIQKYEPELNELKEIYNAGELSLFCGAGVSMDANIASWDELLSNLLHTENCPLHETSVEKEIKLESLLQNDLKLSSLVIARYLKMVLGDNFLNTVRKTLYNKDLKESSLINAITELCDRTKHGTRLKSIVTLNFDELIQLTLKRKKIKYKTIYKSGQRYKKGEIPIFHPHGYLPKINDLTEYNSIIFSEDDYHTQFINPYSWSNLIQLNHLAGNPCLFLGISLKDPNLRRLLDSSHRNGGCNIGKHFIIKKSYEKKYIKKNSIKNRKLLSNLQVMEEQDADALGLRLIWVNSYKEIPVILNHLLNIPE